MCNCSDCKRSNPRRLGEAMPRLYKPNEASARIYRIIRFREGSAPRTVRSNLTLTEAQAHCKREDTHGVRGGVRWFDGYDYMRGCAPKENECASSIQTAKTSLKVIT